MVNEKLFNLTIWEMKKIIGIMLFVLVVSISYGQETLKSGTWIEKSNDIKGSWSIIKNEGQIKIILADGFRTKSAPDLKIFLSKKSTNDVKSSNATKDAVLISKLKSAKGGQEYIVPAQIDLSEYQTIIIHCEEYSVLWGAASIK